MRANAINSNPGFGHRFKTSYFYHIDIVRFLSALMVMGFHYCYVNSIVDYGALRKFTWFGWVGVEIFFVISGVVIANSANGATAKQFLKGRMLRLYPSAWICATITLGLSVLIGKTNLELPYIRSMLLSPKGPWISTVYWTLAVEICFYSLIFFLVAFKRFQSIGLLALTLTCISAAYLCLISLGIISEFESLNILLLRHGCMFALGIWIWLSNVRQLDLWERVGVGVAAMASAAEIRLTALKFLPRDVLGEVNILAPIFLWFFMVCIIVYFMARTAPIRSPYLIWFRTLGVMTYPLYLIHDISGQTVIECLLRSGFGKWTALAAGVFSAVLLSFVIVRLEARVRSGLAAVLNWVDARWVDRYITHLWMSGRP